MKKGAHVLYLFDSNPSQRLSSVKLASQTSKLSTVDVNRTPTCISLIGFEDYVPLYRRANQGVEAEVRGEYTVGSYRLFDLSWGARKYCTSTLAFLLP